MPDAIQVITHVIAARYFVSLLQTIFLAGNIWPVILLDALALVIMATVFLGISRKKFQKRLE
jgi:ABC-2 type transport system permease protein